MLRSILYPTKQNVFIWLSAIYLLFLLYLGKITPIIVVFTYFLETIIIGVFNALKMFWSIRRGKSKKENKFLFKYGIILFFIIHYGFFVGVQSVFGFGLFSIEKGTPFKEAFDLFQNYGILLNLEGIQLALPAIIFTHLGKFISDFIQNKKYQRFSAEEIMFKPYVRIFIQQFVVLFSFFFIVLFNAGLIAAILLIGIRLFTDLTLEAIKEDSILLDYLADKMKNQKASKEDIKKQLIMFTE